jgi:hypothetical protein
MAMSEAARAWYEQDFPLIDAQGTTWLDPSGFKSTRGNGPCFICERPTRRIDINYGAYFCDRQECRDRIRADLEALDYDESDNYLDFNLPEKGRD